MKEGYFEPALRGAHDFCKADPTPTRSKDRRGRRHKEKISVVCYKNLGGFTMNYGKSGLKNGKFSAQGFNLILISAYNAADKPNWGKGDKIC